MYFHGGLSIAMFDISALYIDSSSTQEETNEQQQLVDEPTR